MGLHASHPQARDLFLRTDQHLSQDLMVGDCDL